MDCGILAIHFGEPPVPERDVVTDYLTRIFYQNAELEDADSEAAARERAAELAERRAPALLEEYEEIGGSPMNEQAREQVAALDDQLANHGHEVRTELAFQFLDPTIEEQMEAFAAEDFDRLVILPIYPLCGPSTTVAAIDRAHEAIDDQPNWDPEVHPISGWHRHPRYLQLRVATIRSFVNERGLDLDDPDTQLVFSAHGTPTHYLESGSRYQLYVEEVSEAVANLLGGVEYELGYQNHRNRDIPWTSPDIESVIEAMDDDRVVVEPMSFMHEQSETLAELDVELAADANAADIEFHRVPIPHDDERFPALLVDLVEPFVSGVDPTLYQLHPCQCSPGSSCLNSPRAQ